jgi:chloride channel protein, CIC family
MGTLFAGIIRAPMTSVFMIFELTQDYQILVPLMIANMLSFMISKHFQSKPVYHALLEQNHIYLPGPESRSAGTWRTKNIMTRQAEFIPENASIDAASKIIATTPSKSFLIGDWNHLVGLVTRSEIEQALRAGRGTDRVGALASRQYEYLHADQPLEVALERLGKNPDGLPVLSRSGRRKVEGVVTIDNVMKFIQTKSGGALDGDDR